MLDMVKHKRATQFSGGGSLPFWTLKWFRYGETQKSHPIFGRRLFTLLDIEMELEGIEICHWRKSPKGGANCLYSNSPTYV